MGYAWSKEDKELLRVSFPTMGTAVASLFPNRTRIAVEAMARKMGLHVDKNNKQSHPGDWTPEEEAILRKHYHTMGSDCSDMLPGKTREAIGAKALRMGLSCAKKARQLVVDDVPYPSLKAVAQAYQVNYVSLHREYSTDGDIIRAINAVRSRTKKSQDGARWTTEDDELVKRYYAETGAAIPELITAGHTREQITRRARDLGVRKKRDSWEYEGVVYTSRSQLAKAANVSYELLGDKLQEGFSLEEALTAIRSNPKSKPSNKFTARELELLEEQYPTQGPNIPELLERHTAHVITTKAASLGIKRLEAAPAMCKNDLTSCTAAFTSTNGVAFVLAVCKICGRFLLIRRDDAFNFVHGEACIRNAVPDFVQKPRSIQQCLNRRNRKET